MSVNIYVLALENDKYYIGRSTQPQKRILSHVNNNGSEWTKKYKPVSVIEIITGCDLLDEDKHTKRYMFKYGIDNVRGGSYTQIQLSSQQKELLEMEKCTAENTCFKCGKTGHYVNQCGQDVTSQPPKSSTPKSSAPKGSAPKSKTPKGSAPKSSTPKSSTSKGATPKSSTSKGATPKSKTQPSLSIVPGNQIVVQPSLSIVPGVQIANPAGQIVVQPSLNIASYTPSLAAYSPSVAPGSQIVVQPNRNTKSKSSARSGTQCGRCGRNNHTTDNCYARSTLDGQSLPSNNRTCSKCGKSFRGKTCSCSKSTQRKVASQSTQRNITRKSSGSSSSSSQGKNTSKSGGGCLIL